jgi:hypothetical protein
MDATKLAEALRILGVHTTKREQLAEYFINSKEPFTLAELAEKTGIKRTKIYYVTDRLRDLDILQSIHPVEPRDLKILYGTRQLIKKRRELGIIGPMRFKFSETNLKAAISIKAHETQREILGVIEEATS